MIDFNTLQLWLGYLLPGIGATLRATVVAGLIFPILGILVCYLRLSRIAIIRTVAIAYIEFIRGTPLIGQLFVAYYVFPFIGIKLWQVLLELLFSQLTRAPMQRKRFERVLNQFLRNNGKREESSTFLLCSSFSGLFSRNLCQLSCR